MSEYDVWAEVYDLLYGDYRDDVEFYKNEAVKAGGKVLEVGCGTGRIYLELLREGLDIYGIDISPMMLKILREKAESMGLTPKVYLADMRRFELGERFKLIIIPFRTFLHNLTVKDQLDTLMCCRRHLLRGGKLILNFFNPDPWKMVEYIGKEQSEIIESRGEKYRLVKRSRFIDEVDQIVEVAYELRRGDYVVWRGSIKVKYVYKREFELLLRLAGFRRWRVYGGFNYEPLKSYKQEMVWIIEK